MLSILIRSCVQNNKHIISRILSNQVNQQQEQIKEKWDLFAGVLIERLPIVSKSLTPIEKDFTNLLEQLEFENSLKSDHELRHERDLIQAELIKKGEIEIDLDDSSSKQTAQDLKDAYKEELNKFKFAPRTTEDDKSNNLKSTNRKLEDYLYLVVEEKLSDGKKLFVLPQGGRQEGETMRQTAERILKETCGDNMKVFFYGNAPCGFHKFKYGKERKGESIGAKIFFFRSTLQSGNVDEKLAKNFEWLDKEHLEKKLNGKYSQSVQKFLL